jgi:hypothetical protein
MELALDTSNVDLLRYWMELSYFFFGGIVLAAIAGAGLLQIIIAKRSLQVTSRRDAYRLASERVHHFLTVIIPLTDMLDQKINSTGISCFEKSTFKVREKSIEINAVGFEEDKEKLKEIGAELLAVLNSLEGFAVYFTSGLADELVAYRAVGRAFLDITEDLACGFIPMVEDGYFQNLLTLFVRWHKRSEKQRLEIQQALLKRKSESIEISKINTIGVD